MGQEVFVGRSPAGHSGGAWDVAIFQPHTAFPPVPVPDCFQGLQALVGPARIADAVLIRC